MSVSIKQTLNEIQERLNYLNTIFGEPTPTPSPGPTPSPKPHVKRGRKPKFKANPLAHIPGEIMPPAKKKRTMSAAGRAKIAAAQKARWAKQRANKK